MSAPQLEQEATRVKIPDAGLPVVGVKQTPGRIRHALGWMVSNPVLIVCAAWLLICVVAAAGASWIPGLASPSALNPIDRLQGPSSLHWFGTDSLGRDIFARAVYGTRVSAVVGIVSLLIGLGLGGALGLVAGYVRGRVETVIIWAADVVLSFPALVLLIALVAYTGRSLTTISVILGVLSVPIYTRLARANTLSVSNEEYIVAARASGARRIRILRREVLPNVLPSLVAYGFIAMSLVIVVEGTLSFLGLSVSAPTPSWGGLIADGQHYLSQEPTMVILPSILLCVTVLTLNIAGEDLRRKFEEGKS